MAKHTQPDQPEIRSRIGLLFVLLCGLALAACTTDPPTVTPAPPDASAGPTADPKALPLTVKVLNSQLGVGLQRVAFQLTDGQGVTVSDGDVQVAYYVNVGDKRSRQASGPALFFGENLSNGGNWVVYSPFDSSGDWEMEVSASRTSGMFRGSTHVTITGHPKGPAPGEAFDWSTIPQPAAGSDLSAVTSDATPEAALYQLSLVDAAASKKPTVLYLGSPKHCPTALCRTALTELKETRKTYGERVNFIHIESRDLASPDQMSPAMDALGLTTEPWIYLLNKRGVLSMRIEGAVDRVELDLLLKREMGQ